MFTEHFWLLFVVKSQAVEDEDADMSEVPPVFCPAIVKFLDWRGPSSQLDEVVRREEVPSPSNAEACSAATDIGKTSAIWKHHLVSLEKRLPA